MGPPLELNLILVSHADNFLAGCKYTPDMGSGRQVEDMFILLTHIMYRSSSDTSDPIHTPCRRFLRVVCLSRACKTCGQHSPSENAITHFRPVLLPTNQPKILLSQGIWSTQGILFARMICIRSSWRKRRSPSLIRDENKVVSNLLRVTNRPVRARINCHPATHYLCHAY